MKCHDVRRMYKSWNEEFSRGVWNFSHGLWYLRFGFFHGLGWVWYLWFDFSHGLSQICAILFSYGIDLSLLRFVFSVLTISLWCDLSLARIVLGVKFIPWDIFRGFSPKNNSPFCISWSPISPNFDGVNFFHPKMAKLLYKQYKILEK